MPWFENWFDTNYYHLLYQHRDKEEAIKLVAKISALFPASKFPDLCDAACGKGRHAKYFADMGYQVKAFDLSAQSIEKAKKLSHANLEYYVHDILQAFATEAFDLVTNLFTSFGYFDEIASDIQALTNLKTSLKTNGLFIQDYLNANLVAADSEAQIVKRGEISFTTQKFIENGKVYKNIQVHDQGAKFEYQEQVSLFQLSDFEQMYQQAGLKILNVFGDYDLNPFDALNSPRLIMISQKI